MENRGYEKLVVHYNSGGSDYQGPWELISPIRDVDVQSRSDYVNYVKPAHPEFRRASLGSYGSCRL
jgi:hypothetical protein